MCSERAEALSSASDDDGGPKARDAQAALNVPNARSDIQDSAMMEILMQRGGPANPAHVRGPAVRSHTAAAQP